MCRDGFEHVLTGFYVLLCVASVIFKIVLNISGTFCTLDICISRLEDTGTVDVRGTVERIRSQRAFSIQMPDQYIFCHLALIEYALSKGLIPAPDLAGFENSPSEDSE